jgi:hypothetical protein
VDSGGTQGGRETPTSRGRAAACARCACPCHSSLPFPTYQSSTMLLPLPRPLSAADAADAHPLHAAANRQALFPPTRPDLPRARMPSSYLLPSILFVLLFVPLDFMEKVCAFSEKGRKSSCWSPTTSQEESFVRMDERTHYMSCNLIRVLFYRESVKKNQLGCVDSHVQKRRPQMLCLLIGKHNVLLLHAVSNLLALY